MSYKSNSHSVSNIRYHLIWCTKYRYKILTKEIANRLQQIINVIADSHKIKIIEGSINVDHVHLLIECPTFLSPSQIAQYFKGNSSKQLMREFDTLKKDTMVNISGVEDILLLQWVLLQTLWYKIISTHRVMNGVLILKTI